MTAIVLGFMAFQVAQIFVLERLLRLAFHRISIASHRIDIQVDRVTGLKERLSRLETDGK